MAGISCVQVSPWIHLDDIFLWWPKVPREGLSMMTCGRYLMKSVTQNFFISTPTPFNSHTLFLLWMHCVQRGLQRCLKYVLSCGDSCYCRQVIGIPAETQCHNLQQSWLASSMHPIVLFICMFIPACLYCVPGSYIQLWDCVLCSVCISMCAFGDIVENPVMSCDTTAAGQK